MTEPELPTNAPPPAISHLVRERMEARARRDFARADALKSEIEAAGWRVVDRGKQTSVRPAAPASLEADGETRYGSAAAVPSRLAEPASAAVTVVLVASEAPAQVSRLLAALREHAAPRTQVVLAVNDPSAAQEESLRGGSPDRSAISGMEPEVIRTSARLGHAAALNVALRRAGGDVIVLADGSATPTGDALTPLLAALADPEVALAGAFGLVDREAGPFRPNALERVGLEDGPDVTALEAGWLAFRRADYVALGPLDEHFITPAWLDVWWSLRLRCGLDPDWTETADAPESAEGSAEGLADGGDSNGVENVEAGTKPDSAGPAQDSGEEPSPADLPAPRRAFRLDLPLERQATSWPPDRSRLNRRQMYRVLDRFGWREDLGTGEELAAEEDLSRREELGSDD